MGGIAGLDCWRHMTLSLDKIDFRKFPTYNVQKALSTSFWTMPISILPARVCGVCAVCVLRDLNGWCYYPPAHHHLVIPKNYTRDPDKTVDWWWNIVPVHAECHALAHSTVVRDMLILELARRISTDYLEEPENVATGLLWLREQIDLEGLKTDVILPQP